MKKIILAALLAFSTLVAFANQKIEVTYLNGAKDTFEAKTGNLLLEKGDLVDYLGNVYRSYVRSFVIIGKDQEYSNKHSNESWLEQFWDNFKFVILGILLILVILLYFLVGEKLKKEERIFDGDVTE